MPMTRAGSERMHGWAIGFRIAVFASIILPIPASRDPHLGVCTQACIPKGNDLSIRPELSWHFYPVMYGCNGKIDVLKSRNYPAIRSPTKYHAVSKDSRNASDCRRASLC